MPGAYAHLTMVNVVKESGNLERLSFPKSAARALLRYFRFCELGAVSPDYPYLAIGNPSALAWADRMHYEHTGDVVRAGIVLVASLRAEARDRAFAWLLGYAAHVVTDTTIHPIIELKVGPYAENKQAHRRCEMHQDSYIWTTRMNLGGVGVSKHLSSGILRCNDRDRPHLLDPTINGVWDRMLRSVHGEAAQTAPPSIDEWHAAFGRVVSIAGEGHRLFPIARHVAVNQALTYPLFSEVDRHEYIDALASPAGELSYDAIFDRAGTNVGNAWTTIAADVYRGEDGAKAFFGNWNLDTGRDERQRLVFWT